MVINFAFQTDKTMSKSGLSEGGGGRGGGGGGRGGGERGGGAGGRGGGDLGHVKFVLSVMKDDLQAICLKFSEMGKGSESVCSEGMNKLCLSDQ